MWAFLETVSGKLLLIAGILTALAVITKNFKGGFKTTNNFIKRQKEESETIITTRKDTDDLMKIVPSIEKSLKDIKAQIEIDQLERVKHNIIQFSRDIQNGVEEKDLYPYTLEKCDWYEGERHLNGYVKPHIVNIREAYAKHIKEV